MASTFTYIRPCLFYFLPCIVFRHTEHNGRFCGDPACCLPVVYEKKKRREQVHGDGHFTDGSGVGWDSYGGEHPGCLTGEIFTKGKALPEVRYYAWY